MLNQTAREQLLPDPIENLQQCFNRLHRASDFSKEISTAYTEDVIFCDPLHRLNGADQLALYCQNLYTNVTSCRFDYHSTLVQGNHAFLTWTMYLNHPRLQRGRTVTVFGATEAKFDLKIFYHRDYFDSSQMIWKNIPFVGRAIRFLEKKM